MMSLFLNFRRVKANGTDQSMFKKWICEIADTDIILEGDVD